MIGACTRRVVAASAARISAASASPRLLASSSSAAASAAAAARRSCAAAVGSTARISNHRLFSSGPPPTDSGARDFLDDDGDDIIRYSPPAVLTEEMANGIADATKFYIRCGLSNQRMKKLALDTEMPVVKKWQKMMEVFLQTQLQVIAPLGYAGSEEGLTRYAQDLQNFIQQADDETTSRLQDIRRETWRELVATCFDLDAADEIPTLSIVDARNIMHKVSSKMIEPDTLMEIQQKASKIQDPDAEVEIAKKHEVLQQVIVERVYLGGSPSLVEESGFGSGPQGYAK